MSLLGTPAEPALPGLAGLGWAGRLGLGWAWPARQGFQGVQMLGHMRGKGRQAWRWSWRLELSEDYQEVMAV